MKKRPHSKHIKHLLTELVFPFYELERDLPLPIESHRNETDPEHSWSLALLACSLAPEIDPVLDVGKVCQFAVLHDLTERYAGDTSVFGTQDMLSSKKDREAKALNKIQTEFAHFPWLTETLTEYEAQVAPEAQFVRAVDKVIALWIDYLDGGRYYRERKLTREYFIDRMEACRSKASVHGGALHYWEEVYKKMLASPGWFYPSE